MVVAAETGSGKTHGYIAPIIHQLTNTAAPDSEELTNGEERRMMPLKNISLVLCPNVMLCEQVVRMVNGLLGEDGNPLLRVEAVCGSQVSKHHFIICLSLCVMVSVAAEYGKLFRFASGLA